MVGMFRSGVRRLFELNQVIQRIDVTSRLKKQIPNFPVFMQCRQWIRLALGGDRRI